MSDLRKAAEMALEALMQKGEHHPKVYQAAEALRQALAHQPEPIAWMVYSVDGQSVCITDDPTSFSDDQRALPLWPGPFEREWVGLTDEEMRTLKQKSVDDGMTRIVSDFEYIRSIEAKLKEKNT